MGDDSPQSTSGSWILVTLGGSLEAEPRPASSPIGLGAPGAAGVSLDRFRLCESSRKQHDPGHIRADPPGPARSANSQPHRTRGGGAGGLARAPAAPQGTGYRAARPTRFGAVKGARIAPALRLASLCLGSCGFRLDSSGRSRSKLTSAVPSAFGSDWAWRWAGPTSRRPPNVTGI